MKRAGFNCLRAWVNWTAFDHDISAVDSDGNPREPYLDRLKALVDDCNRRGMIVDVTISHGNQGAGVTSLGTYEAHHRAVETVVSALRPWRNWYLDIANERNVRDSRFVSFADLARLRDTAKRLDPVLPVTASHGGDLSREDLQNYLTVAKVDFVTPHRPRAAESPAQTAVVTRQTLEWMREIGRIVPVYYQEPFRRGYGGWQPLAEDYFKDLAGARTGGAAGWCFHNGSSGTNDQRPRRSFDLRDGPLFRQLDPEELYAIRQLQVLSRHPKQ